MKRSLLCLLLAAVAVPALRGFPGDSAEAGAAPVGGTTPSGRMGEILSTSSQVLSHAVTFRGDGTASTVHLGPQATTGIEWRGLALRQVVTGTVSTEDRENGIEHRYYAQVGARSFRLLRDGRWSDWKSGPCPFFPGYILVEQVDGRLRASSPGLASFHPGPDADPDDPTRPPAPRERLFARR
jgi:hypothetical protein